MNHKKQYNAPAIEVLTARIEKGFLLSEGQDANSVTNEQLTNSNREYQWN